MVPGHVDHFFLRYLAQQFTFFLTLWVLPQVFNNKGFLKGIPLIVSFLASYRPTHNIACLFNNFVKDKTLSLAIAYNFDVLFAV